MFDMIKKIMQNSIYVKVRSYIFIGLVIIILAAVLIAAQAQSASSTTIGTTISTSGTLSDRSGINSTLTLGNDGDADVIGAFEANLTSANTGDADTIAGLLVQNAASPDATVQEIGIYQRGTNFNYGLWTEDDVVHTVSSTGNVIIIGTDAYNSIGVNGADRTSTGSLLNILAKGTNFSAIGGYTTLTDDADATDGPSNLNLALTNQSGDADSVELARFVYEQNSTATSVGESSNMLTLIMGEDTNNFNFWNGIFIQAGPGGDDAGDNLLIDAIDVSDADIVNAINIGSNYIYSEGTVTFKRNSLGAVTLTAVDSDADADLKLDPGGTGGLLMDIRQADLNVGSCTTGEFALDTTGTNEICFCKAGTAWTCWQATSANGPSD